MCKHCTDEDMDFETLGLFKVIQKKNQQYAYDVYMYENQLRIGDDTHIIIEFNYCPMCGRKLGD